MTNEFRERKLYRYDALNRLVVVCQEDRYEFKYYYDQIGNLIAANNPGDLPSSATEPTNTLKVHTQTEQEQTRSSTKGVTISNQDFDLGSESDVDLYSDYKFEKIVRNQRDTKISVSIEKKAKESGKPYWFILRDKNQYGPYSWNDLVSFVPQKRLFKEDLIWCEEWENWARAETIEGLF